MNKLIWLVVAIVVVFGGIYYVVSSKPDVPENSNVEGTNKNESVDAQGRVIFSVTDAAANMNTISEINMQVEGVYAHSSASGWVTVSSAPRTYSLLLLKSENKSELLADVNIKAGTYDQVRLMVDSVSVKTKAGVTKEAKLPSSELKINTMLVVNENSTASVNFDFLADKSLHATGNGNYIFAPVVKTETRSDATVNIDAKSAVAISGGRVDNTNTVGMDIDGSVKLNFQINSNAKLNLDANNVIKLEGVLN
ncbi:hypothetical protein A3A95_03140 [Candidatus Nomurabacteria bacterium RIFCSPLOWO2_01_FULL_39_18]|uniref:DUF4382 domain-containing protein n=1 Tax=Candidatus Nomurabacteria bacterium RIFCSPHIGHO2_01_FULL_40_24b TaxID=1801739 RepID=A0A1F6V760_9BACT|nr:MAG: hypothetical protein A2647_03420 [Candidatus Nomurabacteria bacterium RIFCSPHIGHO2_01_FULL_40_24b]OGI89650.1 MAG: hypothetical protein A3A95_03140 [Candidatus Nomurabacteria bacterium RIFCSPLOWO2_01_FULL_39_18]